MKIKYIKFTKVTKTILYCLILLFSILIALYGYKRIKIENEKIAHGYAKIKPTTGMRHLVEQYVKAMQNRDVKLYESLIYPDSLSKLKSRPGIFKFYLNKNFDYFRPISGSEVSINSISAKEITWDEIRREEMIIKPEIYFDSLPRYSVNFTCRKKDQPQSNGFGSTLHITNYWGRYKIVIPDIYKLYVDMGLLDEAVKITEKNLSGDFYVEEILPGETLQEIADRHGLTPEAIIKVNPNIPADGKLKPFSSIKIPKE
jgi:LysM domain-containing protein